MTWKRNEARSLAVLALGSNTGGALQQLRRAHDELLPLLDAMRTGPLYRTEPLSPVPQPHYLNTVVLGLTQLPPDALLAVAKGLELSAGRKRTVRFGPRPLDIDLLLYGERIDASPELTLPHPRIRQRRFVLAPLADLVPELPVPPDGRPVCQLLDELGEGGGVERLSWLWTARGPAHNRVTA